MAPSQSRSSDDDADLRPYHLPISTEGIDTGMEFLRAANRIPPFAGKAGALNNGMSRTSGSIPQGLIKGAAVASVHRLEVRVRKATFVVTGGIRKKGPIHGPA